MTPEIFKEIRQIQFKIGKLVSDLFAGAYRSRFKGRGMEFEEVREYVQGDEIRTIDWNVTARMNAPYVKTFREERELTAMLLVDISRSTWFGSEEKNKRKLTAEIGALLAFSAIRNNDKIGLILFSDEIELYVPAAKGTGHVLRIIRELMVHPTKGGKTNIAHALSYLGQIQKNTTIAFLISDFLDEGYEKSLKISARKHDLIALRILDPIETEFPKFSLIEMKNFEGNEIRLVDSSSQTILDSFKAAATKRDEDFKAIMGKSGIDTLDLSTKKPYDRDLEIFFKRRSGK